MKKIKILNVIFMLFGLGSIALYFFMPFIKVEANITLTAETVEGLLGDSLGEIDLSKAFEEDGIKVSLPLEIQGKDMFQIGLGKIDADNFVNEAFIEPSVKKITGILVPKLEPLVKAVAAQVIGSAVTDALTDSSGLTEEQLEELGVDQEAVEEQIEKVIDALMEEGATVDTVTDAIVDAYNELIATMNENGTTQYSELSDEEKEELGDQIESMLEELGLVDDDGNITDIESALAALLGGLGSGEGDGEGDGEPTGNSESISISPKILREDTPNETPSELETTLTNLIKGLLPEGILSSIGSYAKYAAYGLFGLMGFWALFVLFTLIKTFSKKKPWTMRGPIFIILQVLTCFLGFVITGALLLVFSNLIKPLTALVIGFLPENLQGMSLGLQTCCLWPSVIILVMGLLWPSYRKARKQLKEELSESK